MKVSFKVSIASTILAYWLMVIAWFHDDVIKWKHFPLYWPFVRGIHRSPVNSPHKGQWRRALMFTLICARINGWVNNREAGDLRRYNAHYDVIVMSGPKLFDLLYSSCDRGGLYIHFGFQIHPKSYAHGIALLYLLWFGAGWFYMQQGKSEEFDSSHWTSNLIQIEFKSLIFRHVWP